MTVLQLIPEVAGVIPTVLILSGHEPTHREVARGQGLTTQLDDADTAARQNRAVLADNANFKVPEQRSQRRQPTGVAPGRGNSAAQRGQQVGIDLVDHQTGIALGEGHRQSGFGHPVGRQDRPRVEAERLARVDQIFDVGRLHRLSTREGEPQRRQVELTRLGLLAQTLGEQRVSEVGGGCHRPLVLVDQLGPQQRVAQKVHWGDFDQLGAEVHRHSQKADHAHVVEARQPADHHVFLDVVLRTDEHRLGIGVHVAVGNLNGFGRPGGTGGELHQRKVVLAGLDGVDRVGCQQLLDGQDGDATVGKHRCCRHEGIGDDDRLGLDHVDDGHGVLGPQRQVGARGGLVQHGQAGAAHPQTLRSRGDLHRRSGQHTNRVAVAHAGGLQPSGHLARPLMHLTPGVANGRVRLTRHHALGALAGIAEHRLGKPAHKSLLGSGSFPKAPDFIVHLLSAAVQQAREHNLGKVMSRQRGEPADPHSGAR